MTDSTTPTTARNGLAAPDRHRPKGSVALPLSPFGRHRPASTIPDPRGRAGRGINHLAGQGADHLAPPGALAARLRAREAAADELLQLAGRADGEQRAGDREAPVVEQH